jgi:hypothetical protein
VLVDKESSDGANTSRTYSGDTHYSFITEIRPNWAKGEATVKRPTAPNGVIALQVDVGPKRFAFWFNPTEAAATLDLKSDALAGTNSSVRDTSMPNAKPVTPLPPSYSLPAGQGAFLVSSPDAVDHEPGWENFRAMLAADK